MLTGLYTDSEKTLKFFKTPDDKYIILTVHYYYPWDFLANWWGKTTWGKKEDKKYPDEIFKKLNEQFIKNGLPIVLGEYGVWDRTDRLSRYYYYDYLVKTAYKYDITCMWWDTGGSYHRTGRYWKDKVSKDIIVNAGKGIPNSFVFPLDNYFKVNTPVEDLTLKLELNDNLLIAIWNGKNMLAEGKDYVLDTGNSTVTIKKDYLSKMIEAGTLGVNATLWFDFSRGTDLPMNIIQYDLPKFSETTFDKSKSDVTSDARIPVSFNGTKLATIKVVDKTDKKPVTKDTWTPYLRMGDHFDYDDNGIIFKKDLLNSITKDSIITFEFWPKDVKVGMEAVVKNSELMFTPLETK